MKNIFDDIFDKNGNFTDDFDEKYYDLLFEDDGNVNWKTEKEFITYLDKHNKLFNYECDAFKLFYSLDMDRITHGNYNSATMWRGLPFNDIKSNINFGSKTKISKEFLEKNDFVKEDNKISVWFDESYSIIEQEYIINVFHTNEDRWQIHVDNGDRDTIGNIIIDYQEEFARFIDLCNINKRIIL